MATRTATYDPSTGVLNNPPGFQLLQAFTSGDRAQTVPAKVGQLAFETDTLKLYVGTGTTAGDWDEVPTGSGLAAVLSEDGSYVGFYDGGEYKGKAQLSTDPL